MTHLTPVDMAVIGRMNRLARMVLGARGKPPSSITATVALAVRVTKLIPSFYTLMIRRLGRTVPG